MHDFISLIFAALTIFAVILFFDAWSDSAQEGWLGVINNLGFFVGGGAFSAWVAKRQIRQLSEGEVGYYKTLFTILILGSIAIFSA